jgi:hypothetical protein
MCIGVLLVLLTLPFTALNAQHMSNEGMTEDDMTDLFVHPFLTHIWVYRMC